MAPLGGVFVAVIGVFLLVGARLPNLRMKLCYVGFAAASFALVLGGKLALGLPAPSKVQIISLILAIVLEIAMFIIFVPPLRRRGERVVLIATLAIVGIHFVVMLPAFGPLILALGLLCLLNAAIAWRQPGYRVDAAWALDGTLKIAVGILLLLTSPLFGQH